jgi:hypothetical protein
MEPMPGLLGPALELRRGGWAEAFQEPTPVEPDGPPEVSSVDRPIEEEDVGREVFRVKPHGASIRHQALRPESPTQGPKALAQEVPAPGRILVRPEAGHEDLPGNRIRLGPGDPGQKGEAVALRRGTGQRRGPPLDRESAEEPKNRHRLVPCWCPEDLWKDDTGIVRARSRRGQIGFT